MKLTVRYLTLILLFVHCSTITFAQQTGEVKYPYLGITFTIPNGWVGQETESGFLVGHQTQPGFGLLAVSESNSLAVIQAEMQNGINEGNGMFLQLKGSLEQLSETSLGGSFEGILENQPVRAYIVGVINSMGRGVSIITAASPQQFSETHKTLALQLARSLRFSKPQKPNSSVNWKQKFSDAKLTYMDSYYSSGGSYGGYSTGGGYSTKREIHLCSKGFFRYKSSDYMSVDTGGGFGSSSGGNAGDGNWEVVADAKGNPVLVLKFINGDVYEYKLTYEDKKTFLNGNRYFVTYASSGTDYAPNCY